MKNISVLFILFLTLISCHKEDDHDFKIESDNWKIGGEFKLKNKIQFETDEQFGRYSEGAFVEIDNNTVLAVYTRFDGGYEDSTSASLVSRISNDRGETWTDENIIVQKMDNVLNVMSVSLIRLNNGDIALIYLIKESIVNCYPVICFSKDNGNTFSTYKPIIDSGEGYFTLNNSRVSQLSSGRIVVPISEFENDGKNLTTFKGKIFYMYSDDIGKTWTKSDYFKPCGNDVTEQEPGIIELKDGSLLTWVRTNRGSQYFSRSYDKGETWTDFKESSLVSPLSPATIIQIEFGSQPLMAVWNNSLSDRKPMSMALSYDNGETWQSECTIVSDCFASYPAIHVFEDGEFLISYCYSEKYWTGLQNYSIDRYKYISD